MELQGVVRDGVIVPDSPLTVPDGTRVRVVVEEADEGPPTLLAYLKLAGLANDLPPDFAAQHDHYLYGTPKR